MEECSDIEQLECWRLFGASWEVVRLSESQVVADLCSCTGELIERRCSEDRDVIDYVRRTSAALPDS